MFDRFVCKNYNKYKNKKIRITYDTKYGCDNEIFGYLKKCPTPMSMANKYTLSSFTIKMTDEPYALRTIPLIMVKNIFLIKENYNTRKNLLLLNKNGIIIRDIYNHILSYVDGNEYEEIKI